MPEMKNCALKTEAVPLWNIRQLIHEKNAKLAKYIPGFVYRYMAKKLHEDEVNEFLLKGAHLTNFEWIDAALEHYNVKVETYGEHRIPKGGKNTFVANHASGSNDGMAYFSIIGRHFAGVKSVSNAFLEYFPNIKDLYVPVNMLGSRSKGSLHAIDTLYASDEQVLHFPSGVVSRRYDGEIQDPVWKKSYINKSVQHGRTIIPAYIDARNSEFFYRLSAFRQRIGIQQPFELFFLVDEMFKNHGKAIRFTFGSPITPDMLTKDRKNSEWALLVRQYVYSLAKHPDQTFQEFLQKLGDK